MIVSMDQDQGARSVLDESEVLALAEGDVALHDDPVEAYARLHRVSEREAEAGLLRLAEDIVVGRYAGEVRASWHSPGVVSLRLDSWTIGYSPESNAVVYYSARDARTWDEAKALRALLAERARILEEDPESIDSAPRPPGWATITEVLERVSSGGTVHVAKGCRKKYQKGVDPTASPEVIAAVFRDLIASGDVEETFTAPIVGTHRIRTSLGTWTLDPGGTTLVGFHAAAEQGRQG